MVFFSVAKFSRVALAVFSFPVVLLHFIKKKETEQNEVTSFRNRQLTSQPLHLPRGRGVWVSGAAWRVSERQPDRCQAPWDL